MLFKNYLREKKMKIHIMVFLFVIINFSYSQVSESNDALIMPKKEILNTKLGFAGSMISGYGLSLEHNLNSNYVLEFTASIFGEGGSKNTNSYSKSYIVTTLGLELQKNMYSNSDSRFYTFTAASLWIDNNTSKDNYNASSIETKDNETSYVMGIGLGWEITLAKRIILNLEGGYSYKNYGYSGIEPEYTSGQTFYSAYNRTAYRFGFGFGGGVYYAF